MNCKMLFERIGLQQIDFTFTGDCKVIYHVIITISITHKHIYSVLFCLFMPFFRLLTRWRASGRTAAGFRADTAGAVQ